MLLVRLFYNYYVGADVILFTIITSSVYSLVFKTVYTRRLIVTLPRKAICYIAFHLVSRFITNIYENSSASGGLRLLDKLPMLRPCTPLGPSISQTHDETPVLGYRSAHGDRRGRQSSHNSWIPDFDLRLHPSRQLCKKCIMWSKSVLLKYLFSFNKDYN